jgi:outer membrane protein assembly factor BamB
VGSLPTGTVLWSLPVGGYVLPAVPSSSGVDAFVLSAYNLLAVRSDGTIAWQTATNAGNVIPDFSGNVFIQDIDMMLLRVSPDGSFANIQINQSTYTLPALIAADGYHYTGTPSPLSVMTNGDHGVAAFSLTGKMPSAK